MNVTENLNLLDFNKFIPSTPTWACDDNYFLIYDLIPTLWGELPLQQGNENELEN